MDGQTEAHRSDMTCQKSMKTTDLGPDLEFHNSDKGTFQYTTHLVKPHAPPASSHGWLMLFVVSICV